MKLLRKVGVTSEIWQIFIADSSSTTGAGLTALTNASGSLTAYYHRDTDTTATAISLVTMTVGTYTSSGFKEIDATNMPGWYQFCPPNAALASGAKSCAFHLKGATNMAPLPIECQLVSVDLDDTIRMGLTSIPSVASGSAGALLIDGTGTAAISNSAGKVLLQATQSGVTIPTVTTVTNQLTAAAIATGVWQDSTSGDFTTASSIGKSLYTGNVAPGGSGGLLISGTNSGTTTFGAITCTGSFTISDGLLVSRSSSNTSAATFTGNGTGHGVAFTSGGGATGDGVRATSASTNGNGINMFGTGTGDGMMGTGGATGRGFHGVGGATSGAGFRIEGTAGNSNALELVGQGSADGLSTTGGATGTGIHIIGGGTSGVGISIGTTSGDGISILPTAGSAIVATANGTSKHGFIITGGTAGTSDGLKVIAGTGGVAIRGNITGTIDTVTTVTNQLTAAQIATGIWQDATAGDFTTASSIGKALYTGNFAPGATSGLAIVGSAMTLAASQHVIVDSGTVTTVTNQLTAAQIATGVWQDTTVGDFTVASSIGKSLYTSGATPGATGGLFIAGTNAATTVTTSFTTTFTGNLTGSVASVTGAVGSVTGNVGGSVASVTGAVTLSAGDSGVVQSGTASAGGASTITIQTALGTTADIVGCRIKITSGTGANQSRIITGYVNGTKVVTVNYAWVTNPDATSVYTISYDNSVKVDSNLKVSGVVLTDTLTTYTGNTVQTGDAYTRIGAAGISLSAIPDLAGVTTLLSRVSASRAGYLDNINNANLLNVPAAPASTTNITSASGIVVATNNDKTNYSLIQAFPANFSALGISAGGKINGVVLTDTLTTYTGNTAQTGDSYAIVNSATFGNAKLIRSATPANALAVTAAGQAGIDWANIGSPSGEANLYNTNVKNVWGNVSGKVLGVGSTTPSGYGVYADSCILGSGGLDQVILESNLNARQGLGVILSTQAGEVNVTGATITIKAANASGTNRITASGDAFGNRSGILITPAG